MHIQTDPPQDLPSPAEAQGCGSKLVPWPYCPTKKHRTWMTMRGNLSNLGWYRSDYTYIYIYMNTMKKNIYGNMYIYIYVCIFKY